MSEIRIIQAPSIYLIGRQSVDEAELARFLADNGSPGWATDAPSAGEALVEVAGRLCYQSFRRPRPGGNAAYIGHILGEAHGSVLEHAYFNLVVTGVSRTLTHELIRHRAGFAYSELSQRYVDAKDFAFVLPPALLGGDETEDPNLHYAYHSWRLGCTYARDCYMDAVYRLDQLMKGAGGHDATACRKRAREAARSLLPGSTETKIFVSANARALRHLLEMRGSLAADAEFGRLAVALVGVLRAEAPNLFADVAVATADDGREYVRSEHRKV